MKKLGVDAAVMLPTSLGDAVSGPVPLQFTRPRMFRVGDVIEAVEPLERLSKLAKTLTRETDLAPEVVSARVRRLVGDGGLAETFVATLEGGDDKPELPEPPERQPTPAPQATPAPTEPADDIFSKVAMPVETAKEVAKSGLDAFVSAVRGPNAKPGIADDRIRVDAVAEIRRTIADAAISILGQPTVARLEASWRGLKMLMASSPGHDKLAVDLLDVDPDNILEALERAVRSDDPHRPNAIFVGIALSPSTLQAVADFAERLQVPVVVGVSKTLTGPAWDEDDPHVAPDWTALREHSSADWLCAAANPVVLVNEETAAGPRIVFGSAAWGVAAILAGSIDRMGSLEGNLGPAGAVVAPSAHELDIGLSEPRTIPTREYADVGALERAGKQGIVLLGSAAGSDQFLMSTNAMAGRGGITKRIRAFSDIG